MKRYISLLLLCVLTVCWALIPTAYAEPTPERQIIYLDVGDTYTIDTGRTIGTPELLFANWYSSDSSKLSIVGQNYNKDKCDVKARASSGGKTITIRVEFEEDLGDPWLEPAGGTLLYLFVIRGEDPQSITLPQTAEITDTTSVTLTPELTPEGAETACTWTSSDPSVATVSSAGLVKGVSKGTAVITAETVNGLTAQCAVTVRPTNVCGDNLEWSVADGILSITGTGGMYDYSLDNAPWYSHNDAITRIVVSQGVTSIGAGAFSSCAAWEAVLPDSLTEIGDEAFFDCPNLRQITLPSGVETLDGDPFSGSSLETIRVSGENPFFTSLDGVLYSKDMTTLVRYPSGRAGDSYCVPRCVEQILYAAFYRTNLKTLYVPETVRSIEYYGISTSGLTVYGVPGSAAEQAVTDYVSYGFTMYFRDLSGQDYAMVSVGSVSGSPGDTVCVPVVLRGNPGFANLSIQIQFDPAMLTLKSAELEDAGALCTESLDAEAGVYRISWDSADNIAYNGTLATLTLEIQAFSGRTPIQVRCYPGLDGTYADGYDVNYTQDYQPLNLWYMSGDVLSTPAGSITISDLQTDGGLRFSVQPASDAGISGVIAAAVYDRDGRLCAFQCRQAAEQMAFAFEQAPAGGRLSVLWLDSLESLKPMAESEQRAL